MRDRNIHSFTLIEVIVVISLIIILVSMSIPALSAFARGQRLKSSGRLICAALQNAKRLAITHQSPKKVIFAASSVKVLDSKTSKYDFDNSIELPKGITYTLGFKDYGPPFDDSAEDQSNPSKDAVKNFSLEYRSDGSIDFGAFTSVSFTAFDTVGNDRADIVIRQRGQKKRCYIDIDPASGRTVFKVEAPKSGEESDK